MKPPSGSKYLTAGTMSGTSLDGLDMVAVEFTYSDSRWQFSIIAAETIEYNQEWKNKLKTSPALTGEQLVKLHTDYGRFIGRQIYKFLQKNQLIPSLIASHGHTVFHQPEKNFTFQLGNGNCIAAETGAVTITDFRGGDVARGGQGAPLVPAGDRMLFPEFEFCLNLGGFANISFEQSGRRIAFDICPANIILNELAQTKNLLYDADGELGRLGTINYDLLKQLNQLKYYGQPPPKSLSREWMENCFLPVINTTKGTVEDKLRTTYEHIALQITNAIPRNGKIMVTGGGAFNTFLIECIKHHLKCEIVLPSSEIIKYKEALIFAFLGLLRSLGEINCFASATGASLDSSTGVINCG